MRLVIKFFLTLFLASIILITGYVYYVFSPYNVGLDWAKLETIISEVDKSSSLDERVVTMYDKIHKGALERSSFEKLTDVLSNTNTNCPCFDVARATYINRYHKLGENDFAIARRIEKKVSQRQCLFYMLNTYDYLYGNKGITSAAKFFFNKNIDQLSDDERIGLLIMLENASLYNPKRFKKRYDEKVMEIKKAINEVV